MEDERRQWTRKLERYYSLLRGTTDPIAQRELHALIRPLEARLAGSARRSDESVPMLQPHTA